MTMVRRKTTIFICTPFQMNENFESWLRVVPVELYTTDAKLQKETIAFDIQWKGDEWRFNLMVDDEKSNIFNNHKIVKAIRVSDKGELIYEYETYLSGQKLPPVIIEKLYSDRYKKN